MKFSALLTPDRFRLWLMVLLVGVFSLGSYWILEVVRSRATTATVHRTRTEPDYFIENFHFIKMTTTGQNKYRIAGARLIHYPGDDSYEISLPVITNLNPDQDPMDIHARRAVIRNKADQPDNEVHLYDNVIVDRPASIRSSHFQLLTDYLLIYPNQDTMQTDKSVEIRLGNTITRGTGMLANNATQQIQLLSNVSSVIPPRSNKLVR